MSQQNRPPPPPSSSYYGGGHNNRHATYDEKDYEEIYYHFDDYSQDIILANASKFMTPPEPAEHYEWEEVILDEVSQGEWEGMKKSLYFGMGCGLLSFGMLRWRRGRGGGPLSGMSRYASSSSSSSSSSRSTGGYTFDALPPKPNLLHQHHHAGGSGSTNNSRSGFLLDVTLSTIIGMGTSLLAVESDVFYPTTNSATNNNGNEKQLNTITDPPPQWISPSIPLVPGRSVISETLCQPLTEEFRKFPKQLWQSGNHRGIENGYNNHMALYANSGWKGTKYYQGNDNASVVSLGENGSASDEHSSDGRGVYERLVLDSLQGFIINCERRSRQEQKLRKIRGLRRDGSPVVIPDGGVFANEEMELDDIYLMESEEDGNDTGFGL